jgi:HK97 family phage prohead protease
VATRDIERHVPLLDFEIKRGAADSRIVTAYAATFDTPYEVKDFDGHYDEVLNRASFDRVINRGLAGIQVMFNHGMTVFGTPSEAGTMPIGKPLEMRAEPKGLLTVSQYARISLADDVLTLLEDGILTGMSFRGAVMRSAPRRPGPNGRPIIERLDLGLKEYGPAVFPANDTAALVSLRASLLAHEVDKLTPEGRQELLALLQTVAAIGAPTVDPEPNDDPPAALTEPPAVLHVGPSVDVDEAELAYLRLANPSKESA